MSQQLKINGGIPLNGTINISHAKNAVLPLLAAALVTKDQIVINQTYLTDTKIKLTLLEHIGYEVSNHTDSITINPSDKINAHLPQNLVESIRSSILFLGPLLALTGKVSIHCPGGDDLARSLDFHMDFLKKMGAKIHVNSNVIHAEVPSGQKLRGAEYTLCKPSVGTTQHMLITAILCEKGTKTIINNCSQEPECLFLMHILKEYFKADIKKQGTQLTIIGNGHRLFTNTCHKISIIPDRIEALTYLSLGLITNGEITIKCKNPLEHIGGTDLNLLTSIGGIMVVENDAITVKKNLSKLKSIKYFQSGEYPAISTDFAPILCALLGVAEGTSIFTETVHSHRFKYIEEMSKFGGDFKLHSKKDNTIIIQGSKYKATNTATCRDIRGGVAVAMAALYSSGTSIISNTECIDRGYSHFPEKISSLGGQIELLLS